MLCEFCGKEISNNSEVCEYCGGRVGTSQSSFDSKENNYENYDKGNDVTSNNDEYRESGGSSENKFEKEFKRIRILYEDGEFDKAYSITENILMEDPENALTYLYRYYIPFKDSTCNLDYIDKILHGERGEVWDYCDNLYIPILSPEKHFVEKDPAGPEFNYKLAREENNNFKNALKFSSGRFKENLEEMEYYTFFHGLASLVFTDIKFAKWDFNILPKYLIDDKSDLGCKRLEYIERILNSFEATTRDENTPEALERIISNYEYLSSMPHIQEKIDDLKAELAELKEKEDAEKETQKRVKEEERKKREEENRIRLEEAKKVAARRIKRIVPIVLVVSIIVSIIISYKLFHNDIESYMEDVARDAQYASNQKIIDKLGNLKKYSVIKMGKDPDGKDVEWIILNNKYEGYASECTLLSKNIIDYVENEEQYYNYNVSDTLNFGVDDTLNSSLRIERYKCIPIYHDKGDDKINTYINIYNLPKNLMAAKGTAYANKKFNEIKDKSVLSTKNSYYIMCKKGLKNFYELSLKMSEKAFKEEGAEGWGVTSAEYQQYIINEKGDMMPQFRYNSEKVQHPVYYGMRPVMEIRISDRGIDLRKIFKIN